MNDKLKLLRKACLKVASANTSGQKSPLEGHCAAVAYMVQAVFGGEIVTGRIQEQPHYWNRLPNGEEVDLTSCQFGGDGYTPFKKGRKVKRGKLVPLPFLVFAAQVYQHFKEK